MTRLPALRGGGHRFGTVALNNRKFSELINGETAWTLLFLSASLCPCRGRGNGALSPKCPRCSGYGYTWTTPNTRQYTETFYFGSVRRPPVLAYRHVKPSDLVKITSGGQSVAGTLDEKDRVSLERPLDYGTPFEVTYSAPFTIKGLMTQHSRRREHREAWQYARLPPEG